MAARPFSQFRAWGKTNGQQRVDEGEHHRGAEDLGSDISTPVLAHTHHKTRTTPSRRIQGTLSAMK